ncbi:transmembrane protein 185B-like [Amphibalanus amphitrite]|uniref:transmembrane protein 185B-like n=1 Tax=Amphibalanus amphitrite TaxID=1232801 RepID=UPI001C924F63|nr:transmembrane protein 185B-like [Amphibalanus amphitrite]XP_043210992.1 transmembrane protein 185B-like [Amphibalanus amphitrite]XP_043210993.1 transmembrane protein 185B-like [Amphibalanus amphitrite]
MDVHRVFQDFNPCKFTVHCCLLTFTALLALRLDGQLSWNYWAVFSPIWLWNALVVLGAAVGIGVWLRYPHFRMEGDAYVHFKAMLISLAVHLVLLMFELLVCDRLQSGRHMWILVFVPLIFISILSIVVCVWAVKHDRSCELELVCAVNILQFIFLALRLDGFVLWSWEVVFVPLWIVLCLSVVGLLYAIIFAGILLRTPNASPEQRRTSAHTALGYSFLILPILGFLVLLANKLDDLSTLSYFATVSPLFVTFLTLMLMSFSSKPNNHWWFGMRCDFCTFLLDTCPCLREYCNISYHAPERRTSSPPQQPAPPPATAAAAAAKKKEKPLAPVMVIDMPD